MASYLRKLILISVITGSVLLLIAVSVGIKQTLFLNHFESALARTAELTFRMASLKERLTYSAVFKKTDDFQQIITEMQAMSPFIAEISNDILIPAELKAICLTHSDIASLIMLLHSYKNALPEDGVLKINDQSREIVSKAERFNLELRNHVMRISKGNSLIIVGVLLTACAIIMFFLLYINKQIILPLSSLVDEITAKRFDGDYSSLTRHPESKIISMITDYFNYFVNLYNYEKETQILSNKKATIKCCGYAVTGEVASEIAHDIIDRANGVINYAEVIHDEVEPLKSIFLMEAIAKLQDESKQIADYAAQMLYSSCDEELCEKVTVKDVLEKILKVLGRRIRQEQAEIVQEFTDDFLNLRIHINFMSMVFLALFLTALENISRNQILGKSKRIALKGSIKNGNVVLNVSYPVLNSLQCMDGVIAGKSPQMQFSEERLQMLAMFLSEKGGSVDIQYVQKEELLRIQLSFPSSI